MPFFKNNNQNIFFEDSAGDGFPIVFMHGFLMDQHMFDAQVNALSPRYRCIRFDARAFGKTEWDGTNFNLYDTASDCLSLMDHLNIKSAVIAGMSQGGYCALRVALKAPERVKGLVLMSTRSGVDDEPTRAAYREMRDTWQQHGPLDQLVEIFATGILGPKNAPEIENFWNIWLPKWKGLPNENIFHAMNNLIDRDEITHLLNEIKCPALVTHGEADVGIPINFGEQLSKDLPNCKEFVSVPEAAHAPNLTHPDIINAKLMQFLEHNCSC